MPLKMRDSGLFDTTDENNGWGPLVTAVIIAIVVAIVTSIIGMVG